MAVSPSRLKVIEEHAEEAAFLWGQRDRAVSLPQYDLILLSRLDQRVEAHLDGLRIAGEAAWDVAWAAFQAKPTPGELFTAAVLAFEEEIPSKIEAVLAVAASRPLFGRAAVSALGWIPYVQSGPLIRTLLASEPSVFRRIGIAATVSHRKNPGVPLLVDTLGSSDLVLKATTLRAIGALGIAEMPLALRANLKAADPTCRYQAAWSLALLTGHPDALAVLQTVAESQSPYAIEAAALAARRLPAREARLWLLKLVREKGRPRIAIAVAGALGEPEVIPWLLDQCKVPELARAAAEAICLVTGADLGLHDLAGAPPGDFQGGPNDNPNDSNVELDPDEPLLWPNHARLKAWWDAKKGGGAFTKETRYLLGRTITADAARDVLKNGYQRQRAAAAIELAILKPGSPLYSVRSPGFVQQAFWNPR